MSAEDRREIRGSRLTGRWRERPGRMSAVVFLLLCFGWARVSQAEQSHFNVLQYHHVADDTPPVTSVSVATFARHLNFLEENGFPVLDLGEALEQVKNGDALPDGAVVITFDDAYRNIYENAAPLLKRHGFPFTVFVATDPVDHGFRDMMTWDMLRELQQQGVRIANHSRKHHYLVRHQPRDAEWLERTLADVEGAQERLHEELGVQYRWFAYPYGEYGNRLKKALLEKGYVAFGQQSGGVYPGSDFGALPRFPASGVYANLETLAVKLRSHPLPVRYEELPDPIIDEGTRPVLELELPRSEDVISSRLTCFIDGSSRRPEWPDDRTFRIRSEKPLSAGRSRYNCTAPSRGGSYYYWFSIQWLAL